MSSLQIGGEEEPSDLGKIQRKDDQIRFSVSPAKFIEMLEDIMGPKEELKWTESFAFIARKEDLAQFHHLLQQKISTANLATLSLFSAEVSYSDGTNRTINTFAALERLYEHNNLKATGFSMHWEVVVDLGSDRPLQRQVVRLDFTTGTAGSSPGKTSVGVRIEHTSTLWANEVLTIFREQLKKMSVRYSSIYVALDWYSKHLRWVVLLVTFVVAFGLGLFYFGSGRFSEDYLSKDQRLVYALSKAVGEADSERRSEVLAQFTFFLYVVSRPNASVTQNLIGNLRNLGYFTPEIEKVFDRISKGDFDTPVIFDSPIRRSFVAVVAIFVFILTFSILAAIYVHLYQSPGFLLLTDPSIADYNDFHESRSRGREIAYHVLAVAIATGCGKLAVSLLELGALILPR